MNGDLIDPEYLNALTSQQDEQDGLVDEPGMASKFIEGFKRGGGASLAPLWEEKEIGKLIGEAVALPFSLPFQAITEGLVESGVMSKRTQEQLGKSVVGALPALMGPRPKLSEVHPVLGEAMRGGKPGHVRVPGAGEPSPPASGYVRLYRGEAKQPIGDYFEPPQFQGQWFTKDRNIAEGYIKEGGALKYIDVPESDLGKYAVEKHPDAIRYSFDPSQEYILGELSTQAKAISTPRGESKINVARVGAEESVKRTYQAVNAAMAERLAEHRKRVKGAETIAASKEVDLTVEKALAKQPEEWGLIAPEETKLRDLHNAAETALDDILTRANKGDMQAKADIPAAFTIAGELNVRDEMLGRNIARGLQARQIQSSAARAPFQPGEIARLTERLQGSGVDADTLQTWLNNIRTKPERASLARQVVDAAKWGRDFLYDLMYFNLLSGPRTHAANITGNTILAPMGLWERTLAAVVPPGKAATEAITLREPVVMMSAFTDGIRAGLKASGQELRGQSAAPFKGERRPNSLSAARLGLEENPVGVAFDAASFILDAPGLALRTEDAFFRGINSTMEVAALATREALSEGKTGAAYAERVQYIQNHLAEFPEIVKASQDYASAQTLMSEVGKLGRWVEQGRDVVPLARVILPFFTVMANSLRWTTERMPVLNLPSILNGRLRTELATPGPSRQLAVAKIVNGAAMTALIAKYAVGGQLTGGGPKDPEARRESEKTRPAYSLKFGDEWAGYNRADPYGMYIGIVADFAEIAGQIPEQDALTIGTAMVLASSKNLFSKTWMQSANAVLEAIDNPTDRSKKVAQNLLRMGVPAFVREAERQIDPEMREVRAMLDTIMEQIPGRSSVLPPKRYLSGQARLYSPSLGDDVYLGWASPVPLIKPSTDPVDQEIGRLIRNGTLRDLSMPSEILYGKRPVELAMTPRDPREGVKLTPQEYDLLVRWAGNEMKVGGKGMWDRLRDRITSEDYRSDKWSDYRRAFEINTIIHAYREGARAKLIDNSPKLRALLETKMRERAAMLLPQGVR